jgi:hypothetical protein
MFCFLVSLHFLVVKKSPLVVKLDPNSKSYQDAVRHNVALLRKCEENKPREREFNASVKLTPIQKEMDSPKPNAGWIAQQVTQFLKTCFLFVVMFFVLDSFGSSFRRRSFRKRLSPHSSTSDGDCR